MTGPGLLNIGKRAACSFHGKLPLSTMAPPSVVPCPPRNFVRECTTMSAPYSIGRSRMGVATVLSTISGTPCLWADSSQFLDVADISRGIADTFTENRPRLFIDQLFDGSRIDPTPRIEP